MNRTKGIIEISCQQVERREDDCPHCHCTRQADVWPSGRANVLLPTNCPHRDKCEREILPGFTADISAAGRRAQEASRVGGLFSLAVATPAGLTPLRAYRTYNIIPVYEGRNLMGYTVECDGETLAMHPTKEEAEAELQRLLKI